MRRKRGLLDVPGIDENRRAPEKVERLDEPRRSENTSEQGLGFFLFLSKLYIIHRTHHYLQINKNTLN